MSTTPRAIIELAVARCDRTERLARAHFASAETMRNESLNLATATEHLLTASMLVEELQMLREQLRALVRAPNL